MSRTVLFLCTGNYYRSRFAEIVFNAEARRRGLSWRAESRGLALERGVNNVGPLSMHAAHRLDQLGILYDDYMRSPQQVHADDLLEADLIVALKADEHRPLLLRTHPAWAERVEYWNVHDVYDVPADEALPAIERAVRELVDRLGGASASSSCP
jgi:protein-tyrosine phosphatase